MTRNSKQNKARRASHGKTSAARQELRKAREELNAYVPPSGDEDETYTQLNDAVLAAEKDVPWILR